MPNYIEEFTGTSANFRYEYDVQTDNYVPNSTTHIIPPHPDDPLSLRALSKGIVPLESYGAAGLRTYSDGYQAFSTFGRGEITTQEQFEEEMYPYMHLGSMTHWTSFLTAFLAADYRFGYGKSVNTSAPLCATYKIEPSLDTDGSSNPHCDELNLTLCGAISPFESTMSVQMSSALAPSRRPSVRSARSFLDATNAEDKAQCDPFANVALNNFSPGVVGYATLKKGSDPSAWRHFVVSPHPAVTTRVLGGNATVSWTGGADLAMRTANNHSKGIIEELTDRDFSTKPHTGRHIGVENLVIQDDSKVDIIDTVKAYKSAADAAETSAERDAIIGRYQAYLTSVGFSPDPRELVTALYFREYDITTGEIGDPVQVVDLAFPGYIEQYANYFIDWSELDDPDFHTDTEPYLNFSARHGFNYLDVRSNLTPVPSTSEAKESTDYPCSTVVASLKQIFDLDAAIEDDGSASSDLISVAEHIDSYPRIAGVGVPKSRHSSILRTYTIAHRDSAASKFRTISDDKNNESLISPDPHLEPEFSGVDAIFDSHLSNGDGLHGLQKITDAVERESSDRIVAPTVPQGHIRHYPVLRADHSLSFYTSDMRNYLPLNTADAVLTDWITNRTDYDKSKYIGPLAADRSRLEISDDLADRLISATWGVDIYSETDHSLSIADQLISSGAIMAQFPISLGFTVQPRVFERLVHIETAQFDDNGDTIYDFEPSNTKHLSIDNDADCEVSLIDDGDGDLIDDIDGGDGIDNVYRLNGQVISEVKDSLISVGRTLTMVDRPTPIERVKNNIWNVTSYIAGGFGLLKHLIPKKSNGNSEKNQNLNPDTRDQERRNEGGTV